MSEGEIKTPKCEPLKTMDEVLGFLNQPPPWTSRCVELHKHSEMKAINMSVNAVNAISVEEPRTFCHTNLNLRPVISSVIGVRQEKKKLPKTLVCHDLANGYHDDSFLKATKNFDAYSFYNWGGIDIFCYFSHHFITIPPLAWINVGHAHGVKVIGTVITEWGSGTEQWDELLASEEKWQNFAQNLVRIAKILKIEGWLLNIENKINQPQELLRFVKYLHENLHKEIDGAELIWYDSVTIEGKLQWQNGLTDLNKAFFDACDGIFSNYSWKVEDIMDSYKMAGNRPHDLYIGIDVWGRNFFGGGMFNTQQAIDVTYQFDCSIAIFAPAWTYEAINDFQSTENSLLKHSGLSSYHRFYLRDRALWDSLWPYLFTSLPSQLPFQTSFCRGHGIRFFCGGECLNEEPWYNLTRMQYQPNANHGPHGYMLITLENYQRLTEAGIDHRTSAGIVQYRNYITSRHKDSDANKDIVKANTGPDVSVGTVIPPENSRVKKIKAFLCRIFGRKRTANEEVPSTPTAPKAKKNVGIEEPSTSKEEKNDEDRCKEPSGSGQSSNANGSIESLKPSSVAFNEPNRRYQLSKRSLRRLTRMDSLYIMLKGSTLKTQYALDAVLEESPCMEQYLEDCFNGGSCLKINPSDKAWLAHRVIRLLYCHFRCEDPFIVCVVTKTLDEYPKQYLNVHLQVSKSDGRQAELRLIGKDTNKVTDKLDRIYPNAEIYNVYSLPPTSKLFKNLQNYLLLSDPNFYISTSNAYGWKIRYYQINLPQCRIKAIDLVTARTSGAVLLGYIGITERNAAEKQNAQKSRQFSLLGVKGNQKGQIVTISSKPNLIESPTQTSTEGAGTTQNRI